jgi:hypothetical protein
MQAGAERTTRRPSEAMANVANSCNRSHTVEQSRDASEQFSLIGKALLSNPSLE